MKSGSARNRRSCSACGESGEVRTECGEALAVALLETDHRPVELAFGHPLRPLDAGPPGELIERGQGMELRERGLTSVATRGRPTSPDPRRIDLERAEQPVDVVGYSCCDRPGDTPAVVGISRSQAAARVAYSSSLNQMGIG